VHFSIKKTPIGVLCIWNTLFPTFEKAPYDSYSTQKYEEVETDSSRYNHGTSQ